MTSSNRHDDAPVSAPDPEGQTPAPAKSSQLAGARARLTAVNDVLAKTQIGLATVLLLVFVGLSSGEVFSRYVLSSSLIWSPELATMALIWSVFLASAVCFRNGDHLIVDVFTPKGPRSQMVNGLIVAFFNLLYLGAVAYYGYLALPIGMNTGTPILGVPVAFGYAAVMVMGITGILYLVENVLALLAGEGPVDRRTASGIQSPTT